MSRFSDTSLWNWIKPEIESAVDTAVGCLNLLSAIPDNTDSLAKCIEPFSQLRGAFYFADLQIAAALADGITKSLQDIQQHGHNISDGQFEQVTDAILNLSSFVDRYHPSGKNDELRLLPFLDDILAASGPLPVAEYSLILSKIFNPASSNDDAPEINFSDAPLLEQTRELHRHYQHQISSLEKIRSDEPLLNEKIIEEFQSVKKILGQLSALFDGSPAAEPFNLACYLIEALETEKNLRRPGVFALLNSIDIYIQELRSGELNAKESITQLNNHILFYLTPCSAPSQATKKIRDQYSLDEVLLGHPFLSALIKPESYADKKSLKAVLISFRDEIVATRTALEQQTESSGSADTFESEPLTQRFKKFSNICTILKYRDWSKSFLDSTQALPASGSSILTENELISLCEKLLTFEDFLEKNINGDIGNAVEKENRSFQFDTAHRVVIEDSAESMNKVILFFEQFLSGQHEQEKIDSAIEVLSSIAGNLKMIGVSDLATLISDSKTHIVDAASCIPNEKDCSTQRELIVNFILYIQLHLESLIVEPSLLDSEHQKKSFLNSAIQSLEQLTGGKIPEPARETEPERSAENSITIPDTDLIDEEILEIFSEEVDEVLESLQLHLPAWAENQDSSALAEIRRGFHTLKGSGRMVNASQIAELAWSIECMLNRLIDGTISFSSELTELIESVILVIPTLLSAFNDRLLVDDPRIENWSLNAERLSKGEPIVALASKIAPAASPAGEIENTADQPNELATESSASESPLSAVPTLFDVFSEECRQHLHALNRCIAQGISDANIEIVSRALHTIRGSANAAGAFGIAQIAGALEPFCYSANSLSTDLRQQLSTLASDSTLLIEQLVEQPSAHFEEEISGVLLQLEELHESIRAYEQAGTDLDQAAGAEQLLDDTVAEATGELLIHGMDCLSYHNESLESWHLAGIETAQQLNLIDQCERLVLLSQDASVPEAVEITTLLQKIFRQLKPETTLDESTYRQLIAAQDTLFRVLDSIAMGQRVSSVDSVTEQLNELLDTLQTAATNANADQFTMPEQIDSDITAQVTADEIDPETLEIFSEEARELCQSIEQAINSWLIESRNELYPEELLRHLHTLKGGARVTGLDNFGSFAHEFESFLTSIIPVRGEFGDKVKAELLSQLEQLIERVDNLSSGVDTRDLQLAPSAVFENAENIPAILEKDDTTVHVLPIAVTQVALTSPQETEGLIDKIGPSAPTASPNIPATKVPKTFSRVSTDLLESLVNLAGESSISRARTEQQVGALGNTLDEMQITLERLRNQIRQVDIETQAQSLRQKNEITEAEHEGFDALEMDRYSGMQQLARSLMESTSDLLDLKESLVDKTRDAETTLLQQSRIHSELQAGLMRTRMVPFSKMVPRIRKGVRKTAAELNKSVQVTVKNDEVEIDRTILERMIPALEHMLRNAVDHGIEAADVRLAQGKPETGTITLDIRRDGGDMLIEVNDDGSGVDIERLRIKAIAQNLMRANDPLSDQDILQFILHSGISTAESITQISGRGVGLNVVNTEIKQLGGSLHISSKENIGTQFVIRLPFTVSVTRALMLRTAGEQFAVPLNAIEGIVRVSPYELQNYYQQDAPNFEYAGQSYQMCYMGSLLETKQTPDLQDMSTPLPVILARSGDRAYAIQVDAILGSHEIVVKPLGPLFVAVNGFSGATILGDGNVVVILDLSSLIRGYNASNIYTDTAGSNLDTAATSAELQVMVVDDSVTVRKVTSRLLRRSGMHVTLAKDGADAIEQLHDIIPNIILLDIEMPNIDGFEVARVIRHSERWKHIPIIMISSRTGEKHKQKAFSIGVNQFLGKPFQEVELLQSIGELTGTEHGNAVAGNSN